MLNAARLWVCIVVAVAVTCMIPSGLLAQGAPAGSPAEQAKQLKDQGKVDEALDKAKAAVHANGADARAHYVLAWVLIKNGDRKEAVVHFQQAIKLGIGESNAKLAREALQRLGAAAPSASTAATKPPSPFVKSPGAPPGSPPAGKAASSAGPPGAPPASKVAPAAGPPGAPPAGKAAPPAGPPGAPPGGMPPAAKAGPPGAPPATGKAPGPSAPQSKAMPSAEQAPEQPAGPPIVPIAIGVVVVVIVVAASLKKKGRAAKATPPEGAAATAEAVATEQAPAEGGALELKAADAAEPTSPFIDFDMSAAEPVAGAASPELADDAFDFDVPEVTAVPAETAAPQPTSPSEESVAVVAEPAREASDVTFDVPAVEPPTVEPAVFEPQPFEVAPVDAEEVQEIPAEDSAVELPDFGFSLDDDTSPLDSGDKKA